MKATVSSILANFKADDYKGTQPPPTKKLRTFEPLPNVPSRSQRSTANLSAASSSGKVIWYNGRRQTGKIIADDGREFMIPPGGAMNRNMVPLTAGGLMHGTRIRCLPVNKDEKVHGECLSVRPTLEPQAGLSCGIERRSSQGMLGQYAGHLAAADIVDLGFIAGVFDGHNGSNCAAHVSQVLPSLLHEMYTARASQLKGGMNSLTVREEVDLISEVMRQTFEATDRNFMQAAQQQHWTDGACSVVALLAHGFETPGKCTVEGAEGGVAKLFVGWNGDCRALVLTGSKKAQRLTKDHNPDRKDEYNRIKASGGKVLELDGKAKVGRRDKYKEKKKEGQFGDLLWLPTSRSFGDIRLKVPHPVVITDPDITVHTLGPEDWALVLVCGNLMKNMSDQEVANSLWNSMIVENSTPEVAAQELCTRSQAKGSGKDLSAIVMRFGWVSPSAVM